MIRGLRTHGEPAVIVQGNEDLRLMIPCWMLDEGCCRAVVVEKKPRIALEAFVALRDLIDGQRMFSGGKDAECDLVMANGERHEKPTKDQKCGVGPAPGET